MGFGFIGLAWTLTELSDVIGRDPLHKKKWISSDHVIYLIQFTLKDIKPNTHSQDCDSCGQNYATHYIIYVLVFELCIHKGVIISDHVIKHVNID
jgi:hypothetical protein